MKVNRVKIGCAVGAILAAMTVLVMTGCGYAVPPPPPPPVFMEEVFNLDDWLDGRSGTLTDEDIDEPFQRAGGQTVIRVVANGLRIEPQANWAGIDFFGYDGFEVGDRLTIEATALELGDNTQLMLQVIGSSAVFPGFDNQHIGIPNFGADGTLRHTVTLDAGMISRISAADAYGVVDRIRIRLNNPAGDGVFIITNLSFERDMAAPNVVIGAQVGNRVSGEAGVVTFPITASFLEGAPAEVNFATAGVVTDLPEGVTPSGSITISAAGAGTGTLTLTVDGSVPVGAHEFSVTVLGTSSMPGSLFISGLVVPDDVIFNYDADYTSFEVRAFRLAATSTSVALVVTGNLPNGVSISNPGIVLDANGSGTATLAFFGDTDAQGAFDLTIAAPGTRASESFTLILGEEEVVFDMQTLTQAAALTHFTGSDNNRGVVSVTGAPGTLVATVGDFDPVRGGGLNDPLNNNWSPITILRPGQARVGDTLTVTGHFTGTDVIPMNGTQIGLSVGIGQSGSLIDSGRIDANNNVADAEFTIEFVMTQAAVEDGVGIRWNSWDTLSGTSAQELNFGIDISSVVLVGVR